MVSEQEKLDQNIKESWFSKIGVQKPYTVFVCIVAIIVLGIFAFSSMKVDLFPDMNIPYAVVMLSPDEEYLQSEAVINQFVEKTGNFYQAEQVAQMLKNPADYKDFYQIYLFTMAPEKDKLDVFTQDLLAKLSTVSGVTKTQSRSITLTGTVLVMLEYDSNATVDTATLLLAVNSVGLDNHVDTYGTKFGTPQIVQFDPSVLPIMSITVAYEGKNDAWFNTNVISKLKSTTGVGEISSNIQTKGNNLDEAWQDQDNSLVKTYSISIQKNSNAVTTEVAANVIQTLENIKRENVGFTYELTSSQAEYINQSIGSVGENLIIGGILALIILFLFLRSLKMTLAIGISIPLAVVGTFVVMYFMGIGLNMVSMSGLALAVGMLVDNSVVVLENIYRLRSKGMSIKEASIKGASQIMMAMLASSLTTICVFFPMFFLEGLIMQVFTDLVWVVILSLTCSFVVAVMFLPSIVATFKIDAKPAKVVAADQKPSWWQRFTAKSSAIFNKVLSFLIDKKWLTVAMALVLFLGSACLLLINGFILMPATDEGTFTVTVTFTNSIQKETDKKAYAEPIYQKIKELLGSDYEKCVIEYNSGAGDTMSSLMSGGESLSVEVKLKDKRKISTSAAADTVYEGLKDFQPETYKSVAISSSSMTGALVDSDVTVTIASGAGDIQQATDELTAFSRALEAKFTKELKDELNIKNVGGDASDFMIQKIDNRNVMVFTIKAYANADTNKIQNKLDEFVKKLLQDEQFKDKDFSIIDDGMAKQMADSYSSMGVALLVGLLLIYLVMVAIFQSFLMPLIILICVPLGFTGAFILLVICGMPLSIPALIGFLILMGVVINNGILAVDYTNQARRDGLNVKEALVAAMNTRMRPIFMTALTTILALVPMALGFSLFNAGGSTALMQPLAVVSIGGLLFGTVTTLLVVPAFYAIFCKDKNVVKPEKTKTKKVKAQE